MDSASPQFHSGLDFSEQSISNHSVSNQKENMRISYAASEPSAKTDGSVRSAESCHICGTTFDTGTNLEVLEEHVMNCTRKLDLKKCFDKIDESLLSVSLTEFLFVKAVRN